MAKIVFSDANEIEYAQHIADNDYLGIPDSLEKKEVDKLVGMTEHVVEIEYNFTVGSNTFRSTKRFMTPFLYRTYETWCNLPESSLTFVDMIAMSTTVPDQEKTADVIP